MFHTESLHFKLTLSKTKMFKTGLLLHGVHLTALNVEHCQMLSFFGRCQHMININMNDYEKMFNSITPQNYFQFLRFNLVVNLLNATEQSGRK